MCEGYKNVIEGSCHCGNIHLDLHTDGEDLGFASRTCQCSFCRRHGASWISDPKGEVRLRFKSPDDVSFYQFGHKTTDFIACKTCGVLMTSVCEIDGRKYAVVNATALIDKDFATAPVQTNFDEETPEGRLERRRRNWIGSVIFED